MDPTNATFEPQERLIPSPKPRLRPQVAEVCRCRHMSLRTEDTRSVGRSTDTFRA